MVNNKYTHRFLAKFIIQTETPIAVGSGEKDMFSDKLIIRDVNMLPYIPGTTIAGVIRHALGETIAKQFFGYSGEDNETKQGRGSEIIFSSANIVDKDKTVIEGLLEEKSDYLELFNNLPIRQHVAIDNSGVSVAHGKFDEEIVYKGTLFCFEIEMLSDGTNESLFNQVLEKLVSDSFRIGSGTRNGFGKIKVIECKKAILNLKDEDDRKVYLNKTSSLNSNFWDLYDSVPINDDKETNWIKYEITLKPDDFYFFGSGFGNNIADITPTTETVIKWNWLDNKEPEFKTKYILIPATSIKGAISHRVAFHYNKLKQIFADTLDQKEFSDHVGGSNNAVKALFGFLDENTDENQCGNVIFSDLIQYENRNEQRKLLNHNAIDRFTGGTIDGALFSEEVIYGEKQEYKFEILVRKTTFEAIQKYKNGNLDSNKDFEDEQKEKGIIKKSFEMTLEDLTTGMLPLGGGVNRGHGCFTGEWKEIQ